MVNPTTASLTFSALEHNFGVIGAEYASILATEHDDIELMVAATINRFTLKVQGTTDESYWWGTCGILLAGAELAKRVGIDLNVPALEEFLIQAFLANRGVRSSEGTEGGSYAHTEQALVNFLNFYVSSNSQFVKRLFAHPEADVGELRPPEKGRPIYIQIARDERKLVFSKRALRDYLDKQSIHPRPVLNGLVKYFKAKELKRTLGAGTVYAQTQEMCYEISVPLGQHLLFENLLRAQGPPQD
jgi:hypothetical protein